MLKNKLKKIFSRTIDNSTHQIVDIYDSIKNQWDPIENIRMIQKGQIVGQSACHSAFNNFASLMA